MRLSSILVLIASTSAAIVRRSTTCADGTVVPHDACCPFVELKHDLQRNLFQRECGEEVHEVLRLAFHDAIGFSTSGKFKGTGADGSIMLFDSIETNFGPNLGTDDAVDALSPFLAKHRVTAGDLIQFAAAVGITNCAGAPRLEFLAGRPNATEPADDGTVPEPSQDVDTILARVHDAGLQTEDMVNLLISHTIARADHVDPTIQQVPFDSTPFTFDTQFFLETLLVGTGFPGTANNSGEVESAIADEGGIRLQSDFEFAHDSRTACQWQSFVNNQKLMMHAFRKSMKKMAVIGQDVSSLVDCSEVIPHPVPSSGKPATYPAGLGYKDVQKSCPYPFPVLATDPGKPTRIPKCPDGGDSC